MSFVCRMVIGYFDPAVVFLDDPARDGQSESRAFADLLRGEERVEDVREVLRRNPRTGVRYAQTDEGPAVSASLYRRDLDQ